MAQEIANNSFTGGMVLDINEIDSPSNTYCSNALNATVATYNGNEGAIQNEMGNCKIKNGNVTAKLPDKSIILGSVEYGGVIYYVLETPVIKNEQQVLDENGEPLYDNQIGSFPSPDYLDENNEILYEVSKKMIWNYKPLKVGLNGQDTVDLEFQMGYNVLHHVDILVEPSFDGSVNLILNDGYNPPRLINSGFQVQDNYNAKIIKRYSGNNTNRYDVTNKTNFNLQTSLYRNFDKLSRFEYEGTKDGGDLKVGNYVFYTVSCDKDGNESDILCESGVISIFIGEDGNPFAVNGGTGNENSYKSILLKVVNIDSAYSYIKLYYSRTTAQNNQLAETSTYKVDKLYECIKGQNDNFVQILFTGKEPKEQINDVDTQYLIANKVKAQALTQNMLFLANIQTDNHESSKEYEDLREFSCRIIPKQIINGNTGKQEDLVEFDLDSDYNSNTHNNYYSSKFIYDKTGYHQEELYRFGIVYIRKDGSLTPVFNTLGYINDVPTRQIADSLKFDFNTNTIEQKQGGYNNYGIVKIQSGRLKDIIGIQFDIPEDSITDNYKGYFFVRQKRIPSILAQGYATNVCEEAYVPSINLPLCDNEGNPLLDENDKEKKHYVFESFVYGHPKIISTLQDLYPQYAGGKNGTYMLRKDYKRRLFSLTDECYAFFDRYSSNDSVFGAFYNYINGEITDAEIGSATRYEIYGGDTEDKYLTFYNNNANSNGTPNSHANSYKADFIYFVKVQLIPENEISNNEWRGIQLTPLNGDKTYKFAGYNLASDDYRDIYKDSQNNYYLTLKSFEYNSETGFPKLIDGGKYYVNENDESVIKTYYTDSKNVISFYVNNTEQSSNAVAGNDWAGDIQRNFDSDFTWDWVDDSISQAVCCSSNYYSSSFVKVELKPWDDSKRLCPKWISLEGNYYTYVAFGPGHSIDSGPGIKGASSATLAQYVRDYSRNTYNNSQLGGNSYDLTVTSFNGKYGYTTDEQQISSVGFKWNPIEQFAYAVYCPEFELNKPYYNNFFTGQKLKVKPITSKKCLTPSEKLRLYKYDNIVRNTEQTTVDANVISVAENVSLIAAQHNDNVEYNNYHLKHKHDSFFSSKAGNASEVGFKFAGAEFLASVGVFGTSDDQAALIPERPFNIVRGIYGPYVGMYCSPIVKKEVNGQIEDVHEYNATDISDCIVNIYVPNYNENLQFETVSHDTSAYYAISDRIAFGDESPVCYRGDCYIGYFTHRVNRNFQDPTAPYNDTIVDSRSFANGFNECFSVEYRTFDTTKEGAKHFNLGDINAIQLGSWVTFPVRSTMNISLRAIDRSYVDEKLLCSNDRSFYPVHPIDASGSYKIPESDAFNVGFNKSGSERVYFNLNQIVYNKVYYKNRICYSNVLQSSALTNGNRIFLSEHYRDYTEQYGEIIKLIDISGNLLVVCEHGVMLVPINERALVSEADGGPIVVNNTNVLPENPKIISDTYGSQWEESVISTPYGIYGVDASNKKIWWTDGSTLKTISDFKVQEFLNNYLQVNQVKNIEKCNIKTHYIKYKNDVIFTLYDTNEIEPHKSTYWNLCWNINEEAFKTFYSWLPYDSQNIGNNLVSVPLPILLGDEHKHYLEEGGSSTVGEVTKYDSDGIICDTKDNENKIVGVEDLESGREFYLWKHGHSNMIPTEERILPTKFYDNQHPFEFEFIVKENPDVHKIFDNLQIISNKAAPESFHYEIVGECYDFGKLKKTAYIRQEALKKLYNDNQIGNIKYDVCDNEDVSYDASNFGRAVIFPLYYKRIDKPNLIYDEYKNMFAKDYNYDNLSGTELVHYKKLDEYRLVNHVKAVDIRDKGGQLRGNMQYKEDKWDVQINPINYVVGNENKMSWKNNRPPILLANIKLDKQYDGEQLYIPNNVNVYARWKISERKEVKVKDKFIKIKVRYTGNELAIISAIKTLYRISYA